VKHVSNKQFGPREIIQKDGIKTFWGSQNFARHALHLLSFRNVASPTDRSVDVLEFMREHGLQINFVGKSFAGCSMTNSADEGVLKPTVAVGANAFRFDALEQCSSVVGVYDVALQSTDAKAFIRATKNTESAKKDEMQKMRTIHGHGFQYVHLVPFFNSTAGHTHHRNTIYYMLDTILSICRSFLVPSDIERLIEKMSDSSHFRSGFSDIIVEGYGVYTDSKPPRARITTPNVVKFVPSHAIAAFASLMNAELGMGGKGLLTQFKDDDLTIAEWMFFLADPIHNSTSSASEFLFNLYNNNAQPPGAAAAAVPTAASSAPMASDPKDTEAHRTEELKHRCSQLYTEKKDLELENAKLKEIINAVAHGSQAAWTATRKAVSPSELRKVENVWKHVAAEPALKTPASKREFAEFLRRPLSSCAECKSGACVFGMWCAGNKLQ